MVLPTRAFVPNYFLWVLLPFFSLLFTDTDTRMFSLLISFYFEGK